MPTLNTINRRAVSMYQSGKCFYFRSAPGRGKSTTIEAIPAMLSDKLGGNYGLAVVNAPNLTPGDTIGFGVPKHEGGISEMVFTLPFFFRTSEGKLLSEYDGGIVFVDEIDKADPDIKKCIGEMALSGRCGSHVLPPGWVVWMAGNRSTDRSGSTKELDHLINRRFELDITDDIAGWETWAFKNHVHPAIITFAMQNPQIVFPEGVPEKQGPFCTPRSLVATGEVLMALRDDPEDDLPTSTDAVEFAAAGIGNAAAAQLFATLRLAAELPAMADILKNPDKVKVPNKPDAQMLVCYNLAARTDASNLGPIIKYVERMPADFAVTFAKAVGNRLPMLVVRPEMLDWAKRNNSLMTTLALLK